MKAFTQLAIVLIAAVAAQLSGPAVAYIGQPSSFLEPRLGTYAAPFDLSQGGVPLPAGTLLLHPYRPNLPHVDQQLQQVLKTKPRGSPVSSRYTTRPVLQAPRVVALEPHTVLKAVKPYARVDLIGSGPFIYEGATYVRAKVIPEPITYHYLRGN